MYNICPIVTLRHVKMFSFAQWAAIETKETLRDVNECKTRGFCNVHLGFYANKQLLVNFP